MIPPFNEFGELPPGVHEATFAELAARFGFSRSRRRLLSELRPLLRVLTDAGVSRVYVDGSFVTTKKSPGDVDVAWVPGLGYDKSRLPRVFFDETGTLAGQADIPGVHLLPDLMEGVLATVLFCRVKGHPERRKGMVLLELQRDSLQLPIPY
jgi:hypothetical protein